MDRRPSSDSAVSRTGCRGYLPTAKLQKDAIRKIQDTVKFVVHRQANENYKSLNSNKNGLGVVKLGLTVKCLQKEHS